MSNQVNEGVVITTVGEALLNNAGIAGRDLQLQQFSIGDGGDLNYNPTYEQLKALTAIPGEWDRRNISDIRQNAEGPGYIVEAIQPHDVGAERWCVIVGYWTADNKLFAVHLVPKWQKPKASSPVLSELPIRAYFVHSSNAAITLSVNPSMVTATRAWVIAGFVSKAELEEALKQRTSADLTAGDQAPAEGTLIFKAHGDKILQAVEDGKMLTVFIARNVNLATGKCRLIAPGTEKLDTVNGLHETANLLKRGPFRFVRDNGVWKQL